MSVDWQIPRNCLAWLLLSQLTVIAPHMVHLPVWVVLIYLLCALWRIMVFQGRWSFPHWSIKIFMMLACIGGIYFSFGTLLGLDSAVALLVSGFSLKLLEMARQRDIYVVIFLAYLLVLVEFIYSQELGITVYMFIPVLTITASLVALHQHGYHRFQLASLKKSLAILLQALPLMLLLFLVFPRLSPLWSVPLPSHEAKTGVSDSLSPGDISSLSQSGALAFRADFNGDLPAQNQLYWRGVVLSLYDGRSWKPLPGGDLPRPVPALVAQEVSPGEYDYRVIQEPSYQPFMFAIAVASTSQPGITLSRDFTLQRSLAITERISYRVKSDPQWLMDPVLSDRLRAINTRLPADSNPRTRQLANELYLKSHSDRDFVEQLLLRFSQLDYYYTLKPPLLGEHSIDEFLFDTRRGFCGHYASSLVFLLRAAGVPARVVAGYMGGEVNPLTRTILVHQFDAHAWAEVWLEGEGWVRFDPTAAVSPARIEQGLEQAMVEEGSFLSESPLSAARYRNISWINNLRLQLDALDYYWASWVLDYRGEKQLGLLKTLLGEVTSSRLIVFILSVGGLVLSLVFIFLFRGRVRVQRDPASRMYLQMCKRLEKAGFSRGNSEGPIDFSRRIAELQPQWKPHLLAATRAYVALSYEPVASEQRSALIKVLRAEAARVGQGKKKPL